MINCRLDIKSCMQTNFLKLTKSATSQKSSSSTRNHFTHSVLTSHFLLTALPSLLQLISVTLASSLISHSHNSKTAIASFRVYPQKPSINLNTSKISSPTSTPGTLSSQSSNTYTNSPANNESSIKFFSLPSRHPYSF